MPEWRYWPAIPLAALVTVPLLGMWTSIPQPSQYAIAASPNRPQIKTKEADPNERLADYTFWLTVFSGALAVLGGLELYWIVRQETWMKKSVEAARDAATAATTQAEIAQATLVVSQRAYVSITQPDTTNTYNDHALTNLRIIFHWENSGNSPTRQGISQTNWKRYEVGGPETENFPDIPQRAQASSFAVALGPRAVIAAEIIDIPGIEFQKSGRVFAWGWMDYNDIFPASPRHRTEFCVEVVRLEDRSWLFSIYHMHNGWDEDCVKQPSQYMPPL